VKQDKFIVIYVIKKSFTNNSLLESKVFFINKLVKMLLYSCKSNSEIFKIQYTLLNTNSANTNYWITRIGFTVPRKAYTLIPQFLQIIRLTQNSYKF